MNSYSPYSGSDEYCLVEGRSGIFYPGTRIENISFPLTISAVQGSMISCLANGDSPLSIYQEDPASELLTFWEQEFDIHRTHSLPESPKLYDPLLPPDINITDTLRELSEKSVIPNSSFPVAALLETEQGFIPGVNVEVSAWSLGLCAERTAISRAVSAGITDRMMALHIYAPQGEFSSPCGACRQVLAEFLPRQRVVLHHGNQTQSKHYVSDLLPYGFTGSSLKKKK